MTVLATESLEEPGARVSTRRRVPGEVGIWVLILGDLVVFTYIFAVFLAERSNEPVVFAAGSEHLNQNYGIIYTLILLLSSLYVVRALHRLRSADGHAAARNFLGAFACGLAFLALKVTEWMHEADAGHTLTSDHFFTFYFLMTGLHALHLVIGLFLLIYLAVLARRPAPGRSQWILFEGGACFWHMVDFLWMVIFPLLYLMP
ncbi:cytochrome c oxidase subunit 3 family protein [Sporichthya brevicatena]|uniref:Cytochrome aa3 subunit 3 n=1 Tax=Sporichthya brevicatena TaxID=171442 RepID=A0ABN1H4N7_9ACTN